MKKLNATVTINPTFTAEDWQLYSSKDLFGDQPRLVAAELNRNLAMCVNDGQSIEVTRRHMYAIMKQNSRLGTMDSEALHFLEDILERIYSFKSKFNPSLR